MIDELQRAFCRAQFGRDFPLWVPEVGGAIEPRPDAGSNVAAAEPATRYGSFAH